MGPAEALGHPARARQRAALHVEPNIVAETDRLDDERVAFLPPDRVTVPPRLQVGLGQRPRSNEASGV
jgi:hypothetical protein